MNKLRMNVDGLKVETFEAGDTARAMGTVRANDGGCSIQPTCGNPSRGEETYAQEVVTRYACCV
ncbi:MAG TPA: hypothetical protein VF092_27680 [Longimicrobium sp.]